MSKITIRSAKALTAQSSERFLWDSELRGFGLRCSPRGRKTFILQYRQNGRTRRMSLGQFGALTPEQARELARRHLGEIAKGEDPSGDRQRERKAPNVSALCDRFLDEHVALRCKPTTQREYRRACELFIKPRLGSLRVMAVTRPDVAELHHSLREKPYQANRVLGVLSKMFNLAEIWGLRPDNTNPTRHVPKYKEHKRERFLAPDEIDRLWRVLDQAVEDGTETLHVASAFKLLLLTGCRLSEIQKLKWTYIRDDVIWLPDAKTGPRRVLLNQTALSILRTLPRMPANPYVIIGAVDGQHVTDMQKPWRRIRKAAGLEDVRIHDLRHTYASIAAMAGHSLPMIGRLLGHTQAQTTARYAHLADDTTRRASNEVDGLFGSFLTIAKPEPKAHLRLVRDATQEER
ncbi:MAG: tyrosine-type recombinase/integrase [Pseudomonadota bacterium]|nr:tyrosine-type recombinase/integrase [Pseudomonadota bacterium]